MQYGLGLLAAAAIILGIFLFGRLRHPTHRSRAKSVKFKGYPNTVSQLLEYRKAQAALANDGAETQVPVVEVEETPVDAILFDSIKRRWDHQEVSGDVVKEIKKVYRHLGRMWDYEGKPVYAINRYAIDGVEHYRPVDALMTETRETPPSEVYTAIMQDEVSVYFDVKEQKSTLQKLIPVLIFVIAGLFVMFMWTQSPK